MWVLCWVIGRLWRRLQCPRFPGRLLGRSSVA
jgi:hypothetical protein